MNSGCFLGNTVPISCVPLQLVRLSNGGRGRIEGRVLNKEASRNGMFEGRDEQEEEMIIEELLKKYPWWSAVAAIGRTVGSTNKTEDTASLFEGKNTRV
jgi:hypothetical protein